MRSAFLVVLTATTFMAKAQSTGQIDSLCVKMCETLMRNTGKADSIRLAETFGEHIPSFMAKISQEQTNEVLNSIYFRFQKNCTEFSAVLDRMNPTKGDWRIVQERPKVLLTRKVCDEFYASKEFKYLESNGDTVSVTLDKDYWTDHFKDGSYSKLKILRGKACQFQIEFIESNNQIRKNFSQPGDRYSYEIYDQTATYYLLSVEMDGRNKMISTFRMYK